jgi:hypothetical protein
VCVCVCVCERERERERDFDIRSCNTLIPGVPLNLYSRSFVVTIKHTQQTKHIYTEKRILRYRDRHEDERESTAREGVRERVRKTQREIPNTNVETL